MATKQSQVRLTDEDKIKIETIRLTMGLPSASSAIRFAVERVYREILREEARLDNAEERRNYNKGLGLD